MPAIANAMKYHSDAEQQYDPVRDADMNRTQYLAIMAIIRVSLTVGRGLKPQDTSASPSRRSQEPVALLEASIIHRLLRSSTRRSARVLWLEAPAYGERNTMRGELLDHIIVHNSVALNIMRLSNTGKVA
jgi:hypothetical protein